MSRTGVIATALTEGALLEAIDARAVFASEDEELQIRMYADGRVPRQLGSGHASVVPYGALASNDGHLVVAIFAEKFWGGFCRAVEHPEWERDLRFATNRDRVLHRDVLMPLVEAAFRTRTTREWLDRLLGTLRLGRADADMEAELRAHVAADGAVLVTS